MPRISSIALVVPWLLVAPASAQQEAWRRVGLKQLEFLGHSIAFVDDLDGDGTRDLLVGAPGELAEAPSGRALLLSGRTLALLRELSGPVGENFGSSVADAGDLDGDGVGDHLVGSDLAGSGRPGTVRAWSGASGALLFTWNSSDPDAAFGASVVGLGDVDGDGRSDVAIGAPTAMVGAVRAGSITIHSGASGAVLQQIDGSEETARLGGTDRMANVGDLDGDGRADLGFLDAEKAGGPPYGVVRVVSGATGLELLTASFKLGARRDFMLASISAIGDVDGDGTLDVLVGGLPVDPSTHGGRAFVLSGANGSTLLQVDLGDRPRWFVVGAGGDFDGDLVPDLVLSTTDQKGVDPDPLLALHSGSSGAPLGSFSGTLNGFAGRAFAAGVDCNGDGAPDVVVGDETVHSAGLNSGEVRIQRWPGGGLLARRAGESADRRFRGDLAAIDDLDGDGATDFVAADAETPSLSDDGLRVHSGRDGRELAVHAIAAVPDGELVALPDLDGDGHDDVAFGESVTSLFPAVEIRSSATGQLLRRLPGPANALTRFGATLAVGVQASGAIHLAIGAPLSSAGAIDGGEVQVYDASSGALLFTRVGSWRGEQLGHDVAFLGDVNGDAVGDWALAAPHNGVIGREAGRVRIVSGVAGGTLQLLDAPAANFEFGQQVANVGDVDGDAIADLAVSSLQTGGDYRGDVRLFAGGSWTPLGTVSGVRPGDLYGVRLEVLPDVNGDGVGEWLAFAYDSTRWELRSGATSALLARRLAPTAATLFATRSAWQLGSMNGDAIPDVLFVDRHDPDTLGSAWLVALDDLLLQFEPPVARDGDTVYAWLRGGPIGNAAGLLLLDVNGVPVVQWIALGLFDAQGHHFACADVGPGLAGTTLTVQGFAIGFDGRLKSSPAQLLTFE